VCGFSKKYLLKMKKNLSKIIISFFILSIFLMPISTVFNEQNKIQSFKFNNTSAQEENTGYSPLDAFVDINKFGIQGGVIGYALRKSGVGDILGETTFGCNINPATWFTNCVALFLYSVVWESVSTFTVVSAKILDYFIYYSTNSSSFKTEFIEKGWAAVRDIANMFFILVLLYIAIKTVLGINVTDNKQIIGYVVIVALLVNFSLFTTKVVIDSSNILAKIFYNNIITRDADGAEVKNIGGEKSLSVQLAKKFNPLDIIQGEELKENPGQVIVVTLLGIVVMGFMMYIFLSVALLFVARVISLWLSMIFSPLAFVSFILPFKIPNFGLEDWANNLFKNAFLAPIFIFFLYIILQFGEALPGLVLDVSAGKSWADKTVKMLVPFIIITILLTQSKKLAVDYSGKMGAAVIKAAKVVGGVVLGAVAGGAALIAAPLVGGAAAGMMGSTAGKAMAQKALTGRGVGGFMARAGMKTLNYGKKASFDVRKGFVGNQMTKITGMNFQKGLKTFGLETKEGGFDGRNKRRSEKILKNFDQFKTTMSDSEVKAWSAKRTKEYEDKRNQADQAGKLKEFEDNNEKPQEFNNATELNNSKLKEYMDRVINTGPLSLLAEIKLKNRGVFLDELNELNYKNSIEYQVAKTNNGNQDLEGEEKKQFIKKINQERKEAYNKEKREERLSVGDKVDLLGANSRGYEDAFKKMEKTIEKSTKAQAAVDKRKKELTEIDEEIDEKYATEELREKEKEKREKPIKDEYDQKERKLDEKEINYNREKTEQENLVRELAEELNKDSRYSGKDFKEAVSSASDEVVYSMRQLEIRDGALLRKRLAFEENIREIELKKGNTSNKTEEDNITKQVQEIKNKINDIDTQKKSIKIEYFNKQAQLHKYKQGVEAGGKIQLINNNIKQIESERAENISTKNKNLEKIKIAMKTDEETLRKRGRNLEDSIFGHEIRQENATKAEQKPENNPSPEKI
jgi:hypothetical protein